MQKGACLYCQACGKTYNISAWHERCLTAAVVPERRRSMKAPSGGLPRAAELKVGGWSRLLIISKGM